MNAIINVTELYELARNQAIGIPILADVVYYLKRSPGINGKTLARLVEARRGQLSAAVQLLTGVTLNELLKQWKLQHTCYLLRETTLSYQDVALLCGYKTINGLSKFLERNIRCTAREYRENRTHGNRKKN